MSALGSDILFLVSDCLFRPMTSFKGRFDEVLTAGIQEDTDITNDGGLIVRSRAAVTTKIKRL